MLAHSTCLLHNTIHQRVQQVIATSWYEGFRMTDLYLPIFATLQPTISNISLWESMKSWKKEYWDQFPWWVLWGTFQVPSSHCVLGFCSKTYSQEHCGNVETNGFVIFCHPTGSKPKLIWVYGFYGFELHLLSHLLPFMVSPPMLVASTQTVDVHLVYMPLFRYVWRSRRCNGAQRCRMTDSVAVVVTASNWPTDLMRANDWALGN